MLRHPSAHTPCRPCAGACGRRKRSSDARAAPGAAEGDDAFPRRGNGGGRRWVGAARDGGAGARRAGLSAAAPRGRANAHHATCCGVPGHGRRAAPGGPRRRASARASARAYFCKALEMTFPNLFTKVPDKEQEQEASKSFLRPRLLTYSRSNIFIY